MLAGDFGTGQTARLADSASKPFDQIRHRMLAVARHFFRELGPAALRRFGNAEHVLYDLKDILPAGESGPRLQFG